METSVVGRLHTFITSFLRVILIHYEWRLDMPSLTNVYLTEYAFEYNTGAAITGSTPIVRHSQLDIGALQNFFNWSLRDMWFTLFVPHIICPIQSLVECHSGSLGSTDRSEWYSTPWVTGTQSGRLICWVYDSISLLDPHILILHKERPLVVWYTSDIW